MDIAHQLALLYKHNYITMKLHYNEIIFAPATYVYLYDCFLPFRYLHLTDLVQCTSHCMYNFSLQCHCKALQSYNGIVIQMHYNGITMKRSTYNGSCIASDELSLICDHK